MTVHVEPIGADEAVVRQFFEIVHEAAGQACAGIADPGRLQLSRVHPADDKLQVVGRFEIGDVDSMTAQAVADAAGGFNSYVEGRTVRADLSRTKRGELDDTIAVFGLVVDADGDKGRDGVLPEGIEPSLCISSSPGNRHDWLFLTRALPANEAHAIGAALRATTGGDHDTGTVTQPYRVAGTPNYPGRAKVARGRVVEPTSILTEGRGYSPEELRAFFPPAAAPTSTSPATRSGAATTFHPSHFGRTADELLASLSPKRREDLAATELEDRSAHFYKVTGWLKEEGYSLQEVVTLWMQFADSDIYDKYGMRMLQEVDRVWPKVRDDPDTAAIGAQAAARLAKGTTEADGAPEAERYREEEDGTLIDVETGEVVSEGRSEQRIEDPRDFPEDELRQLPGVVGDIVDWICDWTAEPIRIHALGAALTIVGTLVARKVFTLTKPCGTNLYVGAIAPSGLGKQHPQDCIRMALDSVLSGEGHCIGWQKSATKLAQALLSRGARLMLVDEFTGKLNGIRGRSAMSHETAIVETLLSLWGTNAGDFQPDASIANGGDVKLKRPGLSLYGASPTRQFSESLASKDVTNGLFNRFLLLPRYAPVATTADPEGIMALPPELAEKLQALHACLPPEQMLFECAGDIAPGSPHLVPFEPAAHEANEENKRHQKAMMTKADKDAVYSLYGRYAEQIKRIALVLACGRHWDDLSIATICADDMAFAGRVVAWSIGEFRAMVVRDMTENLAQQQYKLVLGIVRDAKAMTRNQLTRKVHGRMAKRDLDAIVSSLEEAQEIEIEPYRTKGRPSQLLRLRG